MAREEAAPLPCSPPWALQGPGPRDGRGAGGAGGAKLRNLSAGVPPGSPAGAAAQRRKLSPGPRTGKAPGPVHLLVSEKKGGRSRRQPVQQPCRACGKEGPRAQERQREGGPGAGNSAGHVRRVREGGRTRRGRPGVKARWKGGLRGGAGGITGDGVRAGGLHTALQVYLRPCALPPSPALSSTAFSG